jgi:hypothetical protein
VLPVLAAAFLGFFAVANAFFPIINVSLENPYVGGAPEHKHGSREPDGISGRNRPWPKCTPRSDPRRQ